MKRETSFIFIALYSPEITACWEDDSYPLYQHLNFEGDGFMLPGFIQNYWVPPITGTPNRGFLCESMLLVGVIG